MGGRKISPPKFWVFLVRQRPYLKWGLPIFNRAGKLQNSKLGTPHLKTELVVKWGLTLGCIMCGGYSYGYKSNIQEEHQLVPVLVSLYHI
jgi:hypothetical protein